MSRLPPALLYLTIYNPTLRPPGPLAADDEDAEEQAHILFYTARERAVSRDRMLRQVGLAKALSNFSGVLSQDEPCENVHSQSRRMIMLQPEPDFWIHACVELAKSPRRVGPPKGKKQAKGKPADKGKGKEAELVYDHHEGSIHDLALQTQLMRGYEQFKLIHGSLFYILHTLGQQALELQLERFFTVWAWKWDMEQDSDFGSHLGLPLHPHRRALIPLLDNFASLIPSTPDASPFAIIPPFIVPSTSFTSSDHLSALPPYLRTRIPPSRPSFPLVAPAESITPSASSTENNVDGGSRDAFGNVFLSSMGVRKWGWPGYLTFGKGNGKKTDSQESITSAPAEKPTEEGEEPVADQAMENVQEPVPDGGHLQVEGTTVQVDAESLHEAISSDAVTGLADSAQQEGGSGDRSAAEKDAISTLGSTSHVNHDSPAPEQGQSPIEPAADGGDVDASSIESPATLPPSIPSPQTLTQAGSATDDDHTTPPRITYELPPEPYTPPSRPPEPSPPAVSPDLSDDSSRDRSLPPEFSRLSVYVAPRDDPQATTRRKVKYLVHDQLALAFLARQSPENSDEEMLSLRHAASECLASLQSRLQEEDAKGTPETSLPSALKILQPKDKYIIETGHGTTVSSLDFISRSEHLYNGEQLLSNPDIVEVFSRTQGPQHWYISRREPEGAVFMEVSRKETSLTDVDNELAGVIRRNEDRG